MLRATAARPRARDVAAQPRSGSRPTRSSACRRSMRRTSTARATRLAAGDGNEATPISPRCAPPSIRAASRCCTWSIPGPTARWATSSWIVEARRAARCRPHLPRRAADRPRRRSPMSCFPARHGSRRTRPTPTNRAWCRRRRRPQRARRSVEDWQILTSVAAALGARSRLKGAEPRGLAACSQPRRARWAKPPPRRALLSPRTRQNVRKWQARSKPYSMEPRRTSMQFWDPLTGPSIQGVLGRREDRAASLHRRREKADSRLQEAPLLGVGR